MKKVIWITWEKQRRNRELSKSLGAKLYEFSELHSRSGAKKYIKYLVGPVKTISTIIKERPSVVVCQNPSIVLSFIMIIAKIVTRLPVIVDAHYGGIIPNKGKYRILTLIADFIQKHATMVIVTNVEHKKHVEGNGGVGFVLQDKIPSISRRSSVYLKGKYKILFVCSFGQDEPYEEVFKSCQGLPEDVKIYVTGNYKRKGIDPTAVPGNISLMGFVSDELFTSLLNSVDAVMTLTTHQNCLVCGAYETVAVEKPFILSNTEALKSYFYKGGVYTDNTPADIARAIKEVLEFKEDFILEVIELKRELSEKWELCKQELVRLL